MSSKNLHQAAAWKFIILVGVVSLFSDMTYEGARSITGRAQGGRTYGSRAAASSPAGHYQ